MDLNEIIKLLKFGEKIDVEFKESQNGLNKDLYDTVCAFNNRNGDNIFLGINDQREILDINS